MNNLTKIILLVLISIALAIIALMKSDSITEYFYGDAHIEQLDDSMVSLNDIKNSGPKNTSYIINGEAVTLVNGFSEQEIMLGTTSKVTTKYFGNELYTDLNKDGREDIVFLLTQNSGGSGMFFYVVAALNNVDGWKGSQALFLGDRINPQTTESITNPSGANLIVVNYLDRKFDEPMTTVPSVGKSIGLQLDTQNMNFIQVELDFEGEANSTQITLGMKSWQWIKNIYNNGTELVPNKLEAFTLTFKNDGTFSATTDCNSMGGSYKTEDNKIFFGEDIFMTEMFCEYSQEQEFVSLLGQIQSYFFTNKGELVFDLKFDSGSMIFK